MKNGFTIALLSLVFMLSPISGAAGPYPPAADEDGSTAVGKDNPAFAGWATAFENYLVGSDVVSTWQTPSKALGKAVGDSIDIVGLGRGGEITLIFDPPFKDGEGWDLAVFENSFDDKYLELAYVEVSSDGSTFVRFDNDSLTNSPVGGFGAIDPTNIDGLAGKYRQGFGTPFDLADLATKEEVLACTVILSAITHVRIIDIVGDGSDLDSDGDIIYDPYPTSGSAGFDLDAVGIRYKQDGSENSAEIDPPTLRWPADGDEAVPLNPTLETDPFSAQNLPTGNFHAQTHWQLARDAGFNDLVTNIISPFSLTDLKLNASTLSNGQSYFWRAKFIDNDCVRSEWADPFSFTTTATSADQNDDGIADHQELAASSAVDLNNDSVPDVDQISEQFKVLNAVKESTQVAVEAASPNVVIEYIEALDAADIQPKGGSRPSDMPFGLLSLRVRVQHAGDRETLIVYLTDPAPVGYDWMKYDAVRGWYAYGDVTFRPDRRSLTFTLEDGGMGDMDGLVNGIIVDPAGVGGENASSSAQSAPSSGSAGIRGSDGPGCFIDHASAFAFMSPRGCPMEVLTTMMVAGAALIIVLGLVPKRGIRLSKKSSIRVKIHSISKP